MLFLFIFYIRFAIFCDGCRNWIFEFLKFVDEIWGPIMLHCWIFCRMACCIASCRIFQDVCVALETPYSSNLTAVVVLCCFAYSSFVFGVVRLLGLPSAASKSILNVWQVRLIRWSLLRLHALLRCVFLCSNSVRSFETLENSTIRKIVDGRTWVPKHCLIWTCRAYTVFTGMNQLNESD